MENPINDKPLYDKNGLNILDQNDTLGYKSEYITLLQKLAIRKYFPKGSGGLCLDIGCGFGRLSAEFVKNGWKVLGIDPDESLLVYAKKHFHNVDFKKGGLPELPVQEGSVDCCVLYNVMRALLLMGQLEAVKSIGRYIKEKGFLVVVDNVLEGNKNYISEKDIINIFKKQEFSLEEVIPIRQGRWWLLYCIRYGLIPRSWYRKIAEHELKIRRYQKNRKFTYLNKIFIFQKL